MIYHWLQLATQQVKKFYHNYVSHKVCFSQTTVYIYTITVTLNTIAFLPKMVTASDFLFKQIIRCRSSNVKSTVFGNVLMMA